MQEDKQIALNSTLIIGNGFDLDLGLHTTYQDFMQSDLWPITPTMGLHSSLAQTLLDKIQFKCWFDLEQILANYADSTSQISQKSVRSLYLRGLQNDCDCFNRLQSSLSQFIEREEQNAINFQSAAALFMQNLINKASFDQIFSFNYSDLNLFAKQLHVLSINYTHVHGSTRNKTCILGISDSIKVTRDYDFMYKTSSPHYKSTNVRYALQKSSVVVFWGHSLGMQDYHYFEDFFKQQSRSDMVEKDKRTIIIITKDQESQSNILHQLRVMNDGKINLLYDCNELVFLKTLENTPSSLVESVKKYIEPIRQR